MFTHGSSGFFKFEESKSSSEAREYPTLPREIIEREDFCPDFESGAVTDRILRWYPVGTYILRNAAKNSKIDKEEGQYHIAFHVKEKEDKIKVYHIDFDEHSNVDETINDFIVKIAGLFKVKLIPYCKAQLETTFKVVPNFLDEIKKLPGYYHIDRKTVSNHQNGTPSFSKPAKEILLNQPIGTYLLCDNKLNYTEFNHPVHFLYLAVKEGPKEEAVSCYKMQIPKDNPAIAYMGCQEGAVNKLCNIMEEALQLKLSPIAVKDNLHRCSI